MLQRALKHQRLRTQLLGEIAVGRLRPGDILPGEHQLAEMMRVSRTTVRQTLGDLEREGLVRRVQGKGTFVAERVSEQPVSRTASLALIVPDVTAGYYSTLVSGFDQAANEKGRPIVVCNTHNEIDKQANHLMRLIDQRVAGILMNPSTQGNTPPYQIRLAQGAGIPVVLLHRGVQEVQAPVLELPAREIGRRAGRLIVQAGHRQVGYLTSHHYSSSEAYELGLRDALAEVDLELRQEHVDYYESMMRFDAEDYKSYEHYLEQRVKKLLAGPDHPTALFVSFDSTAEMIYLIAGRLGLRVPDDLAIVCVGGARREGAIVRRLTTVTINEIAAANQAVDLLVDMREGRRPICDQETFSMSVDVSRGETL
jgi:GntR family transcriptional regulator, arabinose operon transcriptional repressor